MGLPFFLLICVKNALQQHISRLFSGAKCATALFYRALTQREVMLAP